MDLFFNTLDHLSLLRPGVSRSINGENRTGEKSGACKVEGVLGPGRKGSPSISSISSGETVTLADIEGCGIIQHIWITARDVTTAGRFVLRDLILRMYWDNETEPSVECPLGDFFLCGFGRGYEVVSMPIVVNPQRGMNCFLSMPFRKHARITLENQHAGEVRSFFFQIDYTLRDSIPAEAAYFHAQWRREPTTQLRKDFVVLDGVKGKGHYIGTFLALTTLQRYWWGEGEIKFYIDGDGEYPTQCSTGTEDYFGGAWSFRGKTDERGNVIESTFSTPFMGYPFYSRDDNYRNDFFMQECPPMRALYRWHIMDPILFQKDLRVELQQIGGNGHGLCERQDDVCTVSYWYQTEPHAAFPVLPAPEDRWPR